MSFIKMSTQIALLSLACLQSVTIAADSDNRVGDQRTAAAADQLMRKFAAGNFPVRKVDDGVQRTGWIMISESGKQFYRGNLQFYAQELIDIGPTACPSLVKWVEHPQMEIRYIAVYSLEKISGNEIGLPTFATLKEVKEQKWKARLAKDFPPTRD